MTTCDRWTLTVAALLGEPWPAMPALTGRVIRADKPPDVEADARQCDREARAALIWKALATDGEGADPD